MLLTNTNKFFFFFFLIINYIYLIRVGFYQSRHSFSIKNSKPIKFSLLYFSYFLDNFFYLSNTFFFYYLKICNLSHSAIKKVNDFFINFFIFLFFLFFFTIIFIDNTNKTKIQYHFFYLTIYILYFIFFSNKKFLIIYKVYFNSLFYNFSFNKTSLSYYIKKIFLNIFGIYYFYRPINSFVDIQNFFSFYNLEYDYKKNIPDYVSYLSYEIFNNIYNNSNYKPILKLKTSTDNLIFYLPEWTQHFSITKKFDFLFNFNLFIIFLIINFIF